MARFKYFCDEVGISLRDLNCVKADEMDDVVVKRGLESLRNGFVFGLWDELMVEERKVSCNRNVLKKMRDIVCKYFVYEKSEKAFESRVLRLIATCKRSIRKQGKEQLMEKCFCECENEGMNENADADGNVDEGTPSAMRERDEIANLKMRLEVLERKCDEEHRALKDALCEVGEEKKMLVVEKKRVNELVKEVKKLKAEKKVQCMQLRMMKRREKQSNVVMEKVRTKSRIRLREYREIQNRLAEVDARMEKEIVKVKCLAEEEYQLREVKLRKELRCKCKVRGGEAEARVQSERNKKLNVQKLLFKKKVHVKRLRENVRNLHRQLKDVKGECESVMNDKLEMEEIFDDRVQGRVNEFLKCGVCTFKNGMYQDCVREVYQDLMTMNVGAKNVELVIRTVLSKLTSMDEKEVRLPKETFAKSMLLEARALAQMQCVSEVTCSDGPVTLCTDATTKWGYHYGTYDMSLSSGKMLTLGLRPMVCGSAEKTLDGFKEIVGDIVRCARGGNEKVDEIVRQVKNTMSDRHAVEKKFNGMLKEYRASILPKVVEGWDDMNEDEQGSMKRLNNFFCGMHFVVGLADQAVACLKVWEKDVLGQNKVGSMSLPGSSSGGCGAERLVRTVCKSVQERACEKSGKPVYFRVFLKSECGMDVVPLAPFRGNRFNILFHNGAGVYHLYPHLLEFFDRVKNENKLMRAVYEDLKVDEYRTEVRALGLIDKIVTAPLWKLLNVKEHVSGMNERYEHMIERFEAWSKDASEVVHGEVRMFHDVKVEVDSVYDSLVKPCENDDACKEVLQCLFGVYVKLGRRMLESQISGGLFENMDEQMKYETRSVPRTNVDVERDFGMFDRLLREKPRATEYAIESLIMCRRNRMSEWRDKLSEDEKSKMIKIAQESVNEQRKEMCERRTRRFEEREKAMREKREGAEKREQRERETIRKIVLDMNSDGPLWLSVEDMSTSLRGKTEKEQEYKVKVQIRYRKKVMKDEHSKDGLLNMSSGGKQLSVKQMIENMSKVLGGDGEHVNEAGMMDDASETVGEDNDEAMDAKRARRSMKVDEMIGRLLVHTTVSDNVKEETVCVILRKKRGMYVFKYDGSKDEFEYTKTQVQEDLDNGDLKEMDVGVKEAMGRDIEYKWLDDDLNEVWYRGRVIDVEDDGKCVVAYEPIEDDDDDDDDESSSEVLVESLVEDYRKREVRFV